MKKYVVLGIVLLIISISYFALSNYPVKKSGESNTRNSRQVYWILLHRKSNQEFLFLGIPGNKNKSKLLKTFKVKTGIPGERPTPLPRLAGRDFWIIMKKEAVTDNPETAPYFLTLNIPVFSGEPYGPVPYNECNNKQCNWTLPGAFGLHGINGDSSKLTKENPGSSGCIRHADQDITYLYHLLDPQRDVIRYYIEDI